MSFDIAMKIALSWAVVIFWCAIAAMLIVAVQEEIFPPDRK